ncbi:hypothetical protein EDB80DRAFT_870203 [Ilyonectria destructans]|nr:hypothetical protein EDB80DRAFT_870203 [Ilyonectria destructans]
MRRYGLRTATAYTLLGQAVAQLATRTVGGEFHHTQPAPADLELRRRQLGSDITSGTISITIAPDETCGFDQFGDTDSAWICQSSRHCSWESGRLNLVFCGLQNLITTCQDSTFAVDTDLCDSACQSNTLIGACTTSAYPSCVEVGLGDGVSTWMCMNKSTTSSISTTRRLEDREFTTLILVDGTPISTFISSSTTTSSTTTSSTSTLPTHIPNGGPNVGAIVGGVVGGLAVIGLTVLAILLILRRQKRNQTTPPKPSPGLAPQAQPESSIQDTHDVMASPTQTEDGATLNSPVKSQRQNFSPPPTYDPHLQHVPGPDGVQIYELDEDMTGHHHGSMQEMH